jgi:hypothetical protein
MKLMIASIALTALSFNLFAQQKTETSPQSDKPDTTIVRVGNKSMKIIDHDKSTEIICGKYNWRNHKDRFNGHWSGLELGFNSFAKTDYSMYGSSSNDFMSLNQGKSLEIDLNFWEVNIGLVQKRVGLVSGMGLSFNDYRFDNDYTIEKGQQRVEPVSLSDVENLKKSKLSVSYLNVPLLVECQIPVNNHEGKLYINGGIIGGVKLGSHTKVKHGSTKDKDHSSFYINSFTYAATARIGYKGVGLFAKYSLRPLFQKDKGPDLTPFTIGISFLD